MTTFSHQMGGRTQLPELLPTPLQEPTSIEIKSNIAQVRNFLPVIIHTTYESIPPTTKF